MPPHLLTNFEMQKYYQNEPKFNGAYSRNNSLEIKGGAYVINLDEYKPIRTLRIAFYVNGENGSASYDAPYFDSFEVKYIPKEVKTFIANKKVTANIFRIQACDSTMCG